MPQPNHQFIIRIGNDSLAFALSDESGQISYIPYECRKGVSIAANLREAFQDDELMQHARGKAKVLVDSPALLIPIEEYQAEEAEEQYRYVFPSTGRESIELSVLPSFKNIVAYAMPKDLRTVLADNFESVKFQPLMSHVWEFLLQRSLGSNNKKLYAYFHDGKMDVCSFNRNRFSFSNAFEVSDLHDAVYFLLGVWKQIGANASKDDLFLAGRMAQRELFLKEIKNFLRRVYFINPSADMNRAPVTQVVGMPLDTMLAF